MLLISGKVDEKATQLHAIASLKVLLDATKPQDGANGTANMDGHLPTGAEMAIHDSGRASQGTEVGPNADRIANYSDIDTHSSKPMIST